MCPSGVGLGWIPGDLLLPLEQYLANQPTDDFWVLGPRTKDGILMTHTSPPFFDHGSPVRFESEGELRYWLTQKDAQDIDPQHYQIGHFYKL